MNIQKNLEHYGWNESMDQTITGLPVYIIVHLSHEFINQAVPLLSVKTNIYGDERQCDDFVFVTIEEYPIDLSGKLSDKIFIKVLDFIKLNKNILTLYWNDFDAVSSIRKSVMKV